jgi:nitroreductase
VLMSDPLHDPMAAVRPLIRTRQNRQFTDEPVADAHLRAITEVARWSGSSRNAQPWRFVTIRSTETLRALNRAGMPQTRSLETAMAAVAVVLPASEDAAVSLEHAYDEGRAAERMLVAAGMLGLGAAIAWVRRDVDPVVRRLLALPEDRMVRTIVALGHPSPAGLAPKTAPGEARRAREESVREERWS